MKNVVVLLALLTWWGPNALGQATTLDAVRKRGVLQCGVSAGLLGFSSPDEKGVWQGFDVDICKAIATAVLGNSNKVRIIPLRNKEHFASLVSAQTDVVVRGFPWTLTNDTALTLHFTATSYYDALGFMVSGMSGVNTIAKLDGAEICIHSDAIAERHLQDFFSSRRMRYKPVVFTDLNQAMKGFQSGQCGVIVASKSELYSLRTHLPHPGDGVVFPDEIAKVFFGPLVRQGDDNWFNIVRWCLFTLINGEEMGVNSKNIDLMLHAETPSIRRLAGLQGIKGKSLGLAADWAFQIIKQVGNYGEIFDKHLGQRSELRLDRGPNHLWKNGGVHFVPPLD